MLPPGARTSEAHNTFTLHCYSLSLVLSLVIFNSNFYLFCSHGFTVKNKFCMFFFSHVLSVFSVSDLKISRRKGPRHFWRTFLLSSAQVYY